MARDLHAGELLAAPGDEDVVLAHPPLALGHLVALEPEPEPEAEREEEEEEGGSVLFHVSRSFFFLLFPPSSDPLFSRFAVVGEGAGAPSLRLRRSAMKTPSTAIVPGMRKRT